MLAALAATGAEWYACYQETHARTLYESLRTGQDFDERARARLDAAALGMLVEDGALLGVGETLADRALTVTAMRDEPIDQVRVMTFVPQPGTPLADLPPSDRLAELVTIATMRLTMPDRLIPASLDVDGIAGLEPRIAAGANVVTSLVPPHSGLAGVSQSELDIDEGLRTAPVVTERLAAAGLRVATAAEYADWVAAARERRGRVRPGGAVRLAVVGGKLQGTEAAYLAGEAGYEVVLIDRRPGRPAAGLAADVHVFDVTTDPVRARDVFLSCDAVLPACEDDDTLAFLASFVPGLGVPLLFDLDAYAVTQSKLRSNELFAALDVPRPRAWPSCGYPAVVKPNVGSGSAGVEVVWSEPELALARARLAAQGAAAVVEEFVAGPSLSIDMVSFGGETVTLAPTWLEFDRGLGLQARGRAGQGGGRRSGLAGRRLRRRLGSDARGARRGRPPPRRGGRAGRAGDRARPAGHERAASAASWTSRRWCPPTACRA